MDKLQAINTKERYDRLFRWFEENEFTNEGDYPRETNLVFEFSDWLDSIDDGDLADRLGFFMDFKDVDDAVVAAEQARKELTRGVNKWLEA